jgi:MFS family permease
LEEVILFSNLLSFGTRTSPKKLFAITLINSSLLAWYFFVAQVNFEIIFRNFSNSTELIYSGQALFYFFGALSAILGAGIGSRFSRRKYLLFLTILGVISSFSMLFFQGEFFALFFGSLLGITLGLVYPVSMSLMADCTRIEDRGKVSGIYILETFLMLAIVISIQEMFSFGFFGIIILLVLLRSSSFLALVIDDAKSTQDFTEQKLREPNSWRSIFSYRVFVLYFVPWLLFLVVTVIADHILWPGFPDTQEIVEAFSAAEPLQYAGTAIFSVVSGVLADRIGRKIPIIIGLVWLGFSFALLSFSVSNLSVFLHVMAIGISFGFLMVVYTAIPADLASIEVSKRFFYKDRERFYAIVVVLPLSVYGAIGAIPAIYGITAPANIIAPFLGMVLFISIVPIMLVKDTLSEGKISARKLKDYTEKVGKMIKESKEEE